jgi:hypothetical protein
VITSAAVTVGLSAVQLNTVDTDGIHGQRLVVRNTGTTDVFLGGSTVTTGNGLTLPAGGVQEMPLSPGELVFAIASVTGSVRVLRVGA